ncbi:helix-turn-helix domain-containing protein [Cohnella sp. REN36]|uniref:helix-turn-helix domain-containing protein n=1 Tax=Cohnella sp. REN36 TaxID=2887347 RepID=UPI001D15D9C1|nr:helix-turn-helix domain-containing protein [Cohnella sp. REN36]MCC3376732.1 helix-turn-helix domain-containing protein [Cohnella sp. REN36]
MPSPEDIELLVQAMKSTSDKRLFQRYQVVYLYKSGYAVRDIERISQLSVKTIYNYIRAYDQAGVGGLSVGASPGAPRKLTAEQERRLIHLITTNLPADLALPGSPKWTLKLVATLIEREFSQTYTLKGASRLLQDLGLIDSDPRLPPILSEAGKRKSMSRTNRSIRIPTIFLVHKAQPDGDSPLRFVENALQRYPTARIAVMMDAERPDDFGPTEEHEDWFELMFYHPIGRA